ncbi:MAG: hypothetical protein V7L22_14960 [Nostoc sp.]|uniref:Ig-like domain-containing protein n=1 Tax=Nostoc sp. TaxID=1180 RepID=UPI002FF4B067
MNSVNDAPLAVRDTASAAKNTAVSIQVNTLLGNDRSIESSSLTITGVSGVVNYTISDRQLPRTSGKFLK